MDRTYQMTYETGEKDGLLKTFTKPNGGTSSFTYDSLGLLVKDTNAEDGSKEIIQTGVEGNGKVEVRSAMGKMYLLEYSRGVFTLTSFPDLDLSKCKCPNKYPYNSLKMKGKCGELK